MLRKLIKHEFNATARFFLPLYLVVALITPISAFVIRINTSGFDNAVTNSLMGIFIFLYSIVLIGIMTATTVFIIYRFYKNMVTEEAYLTHTLPVSAANHVFSKLLFAFIWSILSTIILILSISSFVAILGYFNIEEIKRVIHEGMSTIEPYIQGQQLSITLIILQGIFFLLVGTVFGILTYYLCICLGQLTFKSHRFIGAIIWYVIITIILQVLYTIYTMILSVIGTRIAMGHDFEEITTELMGQILTSINIFTLITNICLVIATIGMFFGCSYILKNKLNLE